MRLLTRQSILTDKDWPIFTRGMDLPPAKFTANAKESVAIVSDGCRVDGTVRRSILFAGVTVGRGAVVEDSIVFAFSRIGARAVVRKSIIDTAVTIGGDARIGSPAHRKIREYPVAQDAASAGRLGGITVIGHKSRVSGGSRVPKGIILEEKSTIDARR
jgi:glucose-1-phosphate adenylyltransferase